MLPAVVKLCCGISYPHLRTMTGLQRPAIAAIGQEVAHIQRSGQIQLPAWLGHMVLQTSQQLHTESKRKEDPRPGTLKEEELVYIRQGHEVLAKALDIVQDRTGWKTELTEENGDVIYSKVLTGGRKVFRLEAVFDATPEELHQILWKVEDMHRWNPSIKIIKVLKQAGLETMVTHEVSAETAGNLIGQRDFLSVRHFSKQESCIYLAGEATQLEAFPPQKGFVRAEDGPTCIIIKPLADDAGKSHFIWLLNMDVKDECGCIFRAGCQSRLSIKRCREHKLILPGTCADGCQRDRLSDEKSSTHIHRQDQAATQSRTQPSAGWLWGFTPGPQTPIAEPPLLLRHTSMPSLTQCDAHAGNHMTAWLSE
ncbi:hypothetical protein UPYG_G00328470 [Umbra pygmaea]|uniref:START domain-containing protein 1 n=1 Tax=Umbra pygmaea TaxID=75934 RepID=A0ABD0W2E2_UMBPY